jgi:hypothetical protein
MQSATIAESISSIASMASMAIHLECIDSSARSPATKTAQQNLPLPSSNGRVGQRCHRLSIGDNDGSEVKRIIT